MTPPAAGRGRPVGLALAFVLFVLLGLPEGVLGTAWPSMRGSLDRPVESLAWLVSAYTAGYFVSTVSVGRTQERLGLGNTIVGGVAATALGLALYTFGQQWLLVVLAAFVLGTGGGTVDASINSYLALAHGPRAMNFAHGMFGVGATVGPILMTGALAADVSWRWVYALLLVVEAAMLSLVLLHRDRFAVTMPTEDEQQDGGRMRWAVLAPMLAVFLLYVSFEASTGQWSFSILQEQRGVSETVAGWAVAAHWGGLTAGRFLLAAVGPRIDPERLIVGSGAGMIAGAAVFWWDPVDGLDLIVLPLIGFAASGVFPALVLLTPRWLGERQTGRAVGYQLAASSAGVILTSAVIGALVGANDLGVVPPVLVVLAVGMAVANVVTQRVASAA